MPLWTSLRRLDPNVRLFLAGEALFALGTAVGSLLMNLHWSAVGYRPAVIGTLLALQSAVVATLALPASLLADRLGRRRLLLSGTALIAAGTALATVPAWPVTVLGQLLTATGWVAILVIEFPVVLRYAREPGEHVAIFSVVVGTFTLFLGTGTLLAGVLPSWLAPVSDALGASTPYQAPLVLGALLTGSTSLVRAAMRIPEPASPAPTRAALRPDALILRLWPLAVIGGLAFGAVAPFLNLIMVRRFAAGEAAIGMVLTAGGLAVAAGSALAPRLAARWGELRLVGASLGLNALLGAVMALPLSLPAFAAAHWLRAAAFSAGSNVAEGRMFGAVPDERRALYSGYRTVGSQLGQTVAAALVGWLLQLGLTGVPFLLAGTAVLAYAGYYLGAVLPVLDGLAARPRGVRPAAAE